MKISGALVSMPTTYPCSDLALPEAAFLPDLVWTTELLHVFAEVALSAVLRPQAGVAFATHPGRALDLRATAATVRLQHQGEPESSGPST